MYSQEFAASALDVWASSAPCWIVHHADLALSLRAPGLSLGVPYLEHTGFICVIPHDEYLAAAGVLETGLSGYRGSSHG